MDAKGLILVFEYLGIFCLGLIMYKKRKDKLYLWLALWMVYPTFIRLLPNLSSGDLVVQFLLRNWITSFFMAGFAPFVSLVFIFLIMTSVRVKAKK